MQAVIGGIRQPLLTTLAGVVYIIARLKWAKGYMTGDPMNRYKASDGWGCEAGSVSNRTLRA